MGAPPNNKNGVKLKDPAIRQEAYRQYCAWIAQGKSKESFYFEHPEFTVCHKTIARYIDENPVEFPAIHKEIAECKSLEIWEQRGITMMLDKQVKSEPALFQMFMRNKFGWDREKRMISNSASDFRRIVAYLDSMPNV